MPKIYLLLTLLVLTAAALVKTTEIETTLLSTGAATLAAVLLDLIFAFLQKRKRIAFPDGAILTGLIVALVLSDTIPWYQSAITAAIAILSKHVLKLGRKPLFNPAAFGLLAAILLFSSGQSWWGGLSLLPDWCIVFVIIGGYLVTQRVNKFPQVFAFLGVYFGLFLIIGIWHLGDVGDAIRTPFVNSALFLAFFMLTDPPTSPASYGQQVWFGIITAIVSVLVYMWLGGLSYLLVGLLAANA